jgi:hypothetical protein
MQERNARALGSDEPPSKGGDGEGPYNPMEGRVTKLEAFSEVTRDDLREIRGDLKAIIGKLGTLPTKSDLGTWRWQWMGASFVIFALIVTALVSGLAWVATIATK